MPKKIIAAVILCLLGVLGVPYYTLAAFQVGMEGQMINEQPINTTNINWWINDNYALRGNYSWNNNDLGLAALYKINPGSRAAVYFGVAENDLTGVVAPELTTEQKTTLITGVEWNLSKMKSAFSLMVEAGISPNGSDNRLFSGFGISLNYRFPPINTAQTNLHLLAKLITLEASDEPFTGQVAVAAVVLNRTKSGDFPGSVREVIYQSGQFNTAQMLAETVPSKSALKAAQAALRGADPSNGALYFYNPVACSVKTRQYIKNAHFLVTARIGNHVFYR